jgi:hypothetical protein
LVGVWGQWVQGQGLAFTYVWYFLFTECHANVNYQDKICDTLNLGQYMQGQGHWFIFFTEISRFCPEHYSYRHGDIEMLITMRSCVAGMKHVWRLKVNVTHRGQAVGAWLGYCTLSMPLLL